MCCQLKLLSSDFFFFKQKTADEMRISDWSSDVCSSDLPEGTLNSWELRFDSISEGPAVVRGQTKYFEWYLPLVRLARKYPVRYVLCTVALTELEKLPRSLSPYVIPEPMAFESPDIFGVPAFRDTNREDPAGHDAISRHVGPWLFSDSNYNN